MPNSFCLLCPNDTESDQQIAVELEHPANQIVTVSAIISGIAGLPGNAYLMFMIYRNFSSRKNYEMLLFNLALINLMICFNNLFLQAQFIENFQSPGCQVAGFLDYFFTILSFCSAPQITVNRYLALHNQVLFEKMFSKKNTIFMCTVPWIFAALMCTPFVITDDLGLDETGLCDIQITTSTSVFFVLCGFHTPVLLSYAISSYCTLKIRSKLRQHTADIGSQVKFSSHVIAESGQVMRVVALLMIIPLVTQMPGVVVKTMHLFIPINPWISRVAIATFFTPSVVNSYLTLTIIKSYRNALKKLAKNFSFKKLIAISLSNGDQHNDNGFKSAGKMPKVASVKNGGEIIRMKTVSESHPLPGVPH